jgi:tetratricopeptide (TPR) repeat protein
MASRPMLARLCVAAALALAALHGGTASAADPEDLKQQTVMIDVTRKGGNVEPGSGIVLCQEADRIYVLTARHVLFGKTGAQGKEPGIGSIAGIRLAFYRQLAPAVEDDWTHTRKITPYHFKDRDDANRDLLLLTVPVSQRLPLTAALGSVPSAAELDTDEAARERGVSAVGRSGPGSTWRDVSGGLLRREGGYLFHSAPIEPGFSGGPLFNEAGALIGINVEDRGTALAGDWSGRALPIDEVLDTVYKLVPATCLKSEDSSDLALLAYRSGMRAIGERDWRQAEALMRRAVEAKPREGGTVHLQGMRYTTYLPHYHLGLALYELGRDAAAMGEHEQSADLLDQALKEWALSEVHQAVHQDKRFGRLRTYQARCRALYSQERQLAVSTAATGR